MWQSCLYNSWVRAGYETVNAVSTDNAVNTVNTVITVNTGNQCNTVKTLNTLNIGDTVNTIQTVINLVNTIDTVKTIKTDNTAVPAKCPPGNWVLNQIFDFARKLYLTQYSVQSFKKTKKTFCKDLFSKYFCVFLPKWHGKFVNTKYIM